MQTATTLSSIPPTMATRKRKLRDISEGAAPGREMLTKRRHGAVVDLIRYLDHHTGTHYRQLKPQSSHDASIWKFLKSKGSKHLLRREHSLATYSLVIFLRFKSLSSDARPWLSVTEVFKRTGVKMCTQ